MRKISPIRLPGDTEEQVAQRTRRLRQEEEARERRASMKLVAKAAARAILEGKSAREPTASEVWAVRALTDDEIRAAVEAGALTKRMKAIAASERYLRTIPENIGGKKRGGK